MTKTLPVLKEKCATCPFREGSPYAHLAPQLTLSAASEASRICHSTGSGNAINRRTGRKPALCRGARDFQLQMFHRLGVIEKPTDEAWEAAWQRMRKQRERKNSCVNTHL